MDVLVNVVLPLVTLVSGWTLASWTNRRHRNWDALGADLDLADKLEKHYPEHARWIRASVAVRLKGRALSESRSRSDFLVTAAGVFMGLAGCVISLIGFEGFAEAQDGFRKASAAAPAIGGLLLVLAGVYMTYEGIKNSPRLPGVSELFLPQGTQIQKDLFRQLGKLHDSAVRLPNVFPEPAVKTVSSSEHETPQSVPEAQDRGTEPRTPAAQPDGVLRGES
ncbi:hypothetical protein [Mycobacteroides abscessus]|uniref:hypothetical protein n=1 Tax=Mycobacteroides abscessus TaxID=36809 RepID=UPI0009A8C7BF|nr:hypothetical protein [Mycobacteroides abscessus]MBN7314136.1 hypothetical protein [Mycobacteroides abscessus subsp. abscessus]SKG10545.1 Uncharacterised protein [Mycobacteroides abscessus subsp. massiliense]